MWVALSTQPAVPKKLSRSNAGKSLKKAVFLETTKILRGRNSKVLHPASLLILWNRHAILYKSFKFISSSRWCFNHWSEFAWAIMQVRVLFSVLSQIKFPMEISLKFYFTRLPVFLNVIYVSAYSFGSVLYRIYA